MRGGGALVVLLSPDATTDARGLGGAGAGGAQPQAAPITQTAAKPLRNPEARDVEPLETQASLASRTRRHSKG